MHRIYLEQSDPLQVNIVDEARVSVEVDDETADRWWRVSAEWAEIQAEMDAAWRKVEFGS